MTNEKRIQLMLNAHAEDGHASLLQVDGGWQIGFTRKDTNAIEYGNTYYSLHSIAAVFARKRGLDIYGSDQKLLPITKLCQAIHEHIAEYGKDHHY